MKNKKITVYRYDPVCRKKVNKHKAHHVHRFNNEQFLVCCPECQAQFEGNRQEYMDRARRFEVKTNKRRA